MSESIYGLGGIKGSAFLEGLTKVDRTVGDLSFSEVLKARLERESGITFSAHSVERLRERGVQLGTAELTRLSEAVANAESKGASESLVLIDDSAFIVSIDNRTVVTAMTGESIRNNVFTNIDSTVIA